jgi:hypothetical protein
VPKYRPRKGRHVGGSRSERQNRPQDRRAVSPRSFLFTLDPQYHGREMPDGLRRLLKQTRATEGQINALARGPVRFHCADEATCQFIVGRLRDLPFGRVEPASSDQRLAS